MAVITVLSSSSITTSVQLRTVQFFKDNQPATTDYVADVTAPDTPFDPPQVRTVSELLSLHDRTPFKTIATGGGGGGGGTRPASGVVYPRRV